MIRVSVGDALSVLLRLLTIHTIPELVSMSLNLWRAHLVLLGPLVCCLIKSFPCQDWLSCLGTSVEASSSLFFLLIEFSICTETLVLFLSGFIC